MDRIFSIQSTLITKKLASSLFLSVPQIVYDEIASVKSGKVSAPSIAPTT